MIYSIGIDAIEIKRIAEMIRQHGQKFIRRIFTQKEIEYCRGKKSFVHSYAVRFAAKEAFSKALGLGWEGRLNWTDVEVLNDNNGKPRIFLHQKAKKETRGKKVHVSLSHNHLQAVAIVLIEDKKG